MNGVCVRWRGWIDLERLDGIGCLEYDNEKATVEDSALRDQIERYNQKVREFEERQRIYRGSQERSQNTEAELRISNGSILISSHQRHLNGVATINGNENNGSRCRHITSGSHRPSICPVPPPPPPPPPPSSSSSQS